MFDRVLLRGDSVVALPRRGTKTASAVAFELATGRELEIATLAAAESGDGVRLETRVSHPQGPLLPTCEQCEHLARYAA
jgi:hypothetical protein